MSKIQIQDLYDLNETIAAELFEGLTYPWEALPKIGEFIKKLGKTLSEEEYDKIGEDVWIAKSAKVFDSAYIHGPAIIGKEAEGSFIKFWEIMKSVWIRRRKIAACRTIRIWRLLSN